MICPVCFNHAARNPGTTGDICLRSSSGKYHNIFLDLHAVNPAHIKSGNIYFGLKLVPWGSVWKVEIPTAENSMVSELKQWMSDDASSFATYRPLANKATWAIDVDSELELRADSLSLGGRTANFIQGQVMKRLGVKRLLLEGKFSELVRGSACYKGMNQDAEAEFVVPIELSECHYSPGGPGTWEHAALQVVRDSVYQRALYMLTNGMSIKDQSGDVSAALLNGAAALLDDLWLGVYRDGRTTTYSRTDFVKNRALAHAQLNLPRMRQRFAQSSASALSTAESKMLGALTVYLREANDDDKAKFQRIADQYSAVEAV